MKNILKYIAIILIALNIVSCDEDDFLTRESTDQLSSNLFWRDAADAKAALTTAYSELEARQNFWDGWQEGRSVVEWYRSDYMLPGVDGNNYAHWMSMFNGTYTDGHTFINLLWRLNYRGLNYANQVITNVALMDGATITETERKHFIAEATFLRAYYHFKLLTLYKQIVVRKGVVEEANLDKALSTRVETWAVILQDFKDAAANLPVSYGSSDIGRATKGAALAYLGKAYLHKAGDVESSESDDYKNAADALDAVMKLTAYSLEGNYGSMFDGTNQNSSESIFEIQINSPSADAYNRTNLHKFIGDPMYDGWGGIAATQALLTEMQSEGKTSTNGGYDERLYASLYYKGDYYNDNPNMQGYTWDFLSNQQYGSVDAVDTKVFLRKFIPKSTWGVYNDDLNVPLMRYADVLLMRAEALNENANTAEAITLINLVRTMHGKMPAITAVSKADVKTQIIHERTMEFQLESSRFFDLRRWGMLDAAMNAAGRSLNSANHAYLPVPLTEVKNNSEVN
ncbi:RagB/SusD family nutrient uptake outer membrane protein [Polaribacter sp. ALD11]|uniref:RagB/SusD family nutrient uptake outer membrane protein n=1 Tax=Polaribacter sp. ALD11 TaxID=2058137 RepID=UPI000C3173D5|nr:RagB/SusD family nutrient uptake outer membrane protein [Polaribacter sp. ALD11]AUC86292.1 RagB/SusD family nutrient uptake outer membrane protein [Polaribacter sp. ALD11]